MKLITKHDVRRASRIASITVFGMAVACQSLAFADVKQGVDAWEHGDYDTAVKQWREPALNGNADAQFNMGQAYKLGRGVPMDLEIAQDWFRRAAEQGHLQATDNYGLILFQNNHREEAMPYIQASAARGEPRAQYVLGTSYFNGDLVEKDWVRAYALMTRSAASGLPQATRSLAAMDNYLSLEQRQEAVALAEQIDHDATAERARLAAAEPISETPKPSPAAPVQFASASPPKAIKPAVLPPSRVPAEGIGTESEATAADSLPAKGAWRVQLGAFSSRERAERLWDALPGKFPELSSRQPVYAPAGKLTTSQAGTFATRDEAAEICAQLNAGGQPCFPVK